MAAHTRNQGQDLKHDRSSSETEKFEIINASVVTTSNVEDFLQPNIQQSYENLKTEANAQSEQDNARNRNYSFIQEVSDSDILKRQKSHDAVKYPGGISNNHLHSEVDLAF